MTTKSTDHLFVYGTLMRAAAAASMGREMRVRLARASDLIGAAHIAGRLLDRGSYPVLLAPRVPGDIVHGELLRLHDADGAFSWLDPYESIPPGTTRGDEYERIMRQVQLRDGRAVDAWVYFCINEPHGARPMPDGRWRP